MALPMILSLLGSAAAGANMLGTMSPLLAGSLGTGIGSLLQGDSLGDAVKKGVTGYGIGWGLGKVGQHFGMGGVGAGAGGVEGEMAGMGDPMIWNAAGDPAVAGAGAPAVAAPAASAPSNLMSKYLTTTHTGLEGGVAPATEGKFADRLFTGAMGPYGSRTPAALGAAFGPAFLYPNMPGYGEDGDDEWVPQAEPTDRGYRPPPAGYRPGYDPEHLYFDPYPAPATRYMNRGGFVVTPTGMTDSIPLSPGGVADVAAAGTAENASDRDLVTLAYAALRGELSDEAAASVLMQFVSVHGREALQSIVDQIAQGGAPAEVTAIGNSGTRMVRGAEATDMIPAVDSAGGHVLLNDKEVVLPSKAVAGAGDGDAEVGAARLAGLAEILASRSAA